MAKMNVNPNNCLIKKIMGIIQHYDSDKYWKRRKIVVNPADKTNKLIKLYYLFYIKKCDAYNNASMGTDLNQGAIFETRPKLPHGLNGIIVHLKAHIGANAVIWQQVTIGSSGGGTPWIGDNCKIGAGAKILGKIKIGDNVTIGANTVVTKDIPDNCTVVGQQMRILENKDIDSSLFKFENDIKSTVDQDIEDKDDMSSICERILDFLENDKETGLKFGVPLLDDVIGGLFKGELTTIAARSGVGKTALALQIMLNCASQGKKVLFISREMSNEQIVMRNISKKTGISAKSLKYKNLKEIDWKNIIDVMHEFSKDNLIYINDRISTISQLKRRIRQVKPDLVIVDYLQLLTVEQNLQNREREVATLSRELKNITLDFHIPVIQLSQLNDEMKDLRPWGERPMRDSKAIFHDSNNVVYIHEPVLSDFEEAVTKIKRDKKSVLKAREDGIKIVDLIVAKCRDGETKFRHYCYNGPRLHFQHIDY